MSHERQNYEATVEFLKIKIDCYWLLNLRPRLLCDLKSLTQSNKCTMVSAQLRQPILAQKLGKQNTWKHALYNIVEVHIMMLNSFFWH